MNGFEKFREQHHPGTVESGREYHLRKYLRETDQAFAKNLAQRYREVVPSDHIKKMEELPTRFEDRKGFDRSYRKAGGEMPGADAKVLGFSRQALESAHVATDHLEVSRTIMHERIHQLADPRSRVLLGKKFHEGVTEDLAIENVGTKPVREPAYPKETRLAREVRNICGNRAIEKAYFQGDTRELRSCLDRIVGPGGLERIRNLAADLPPLDPNLRNKEVREHE